MNSNNQDNNIAGALTYPVRDEEPPTAMHHQPRPPRNMQGLLRFAMEATKAEDAPGNSDLGPMDEERRQFLEEALKSLTVDVAHVLQDAIKVLTNSEKMNSIQLGEALPEDVSAAFQNIMEFVDDVDIANDFCKLGGFAAFPVALGSENEEVRGRAAALLAALCQNNPRCQRAALERGLLAALLRLAAAEAGDALAACVAAISSVCRGCDAACAELLARGGCAALAGALRQEHAKARARAAFLALQLCRASGAARAALVERGAVPAIAARLAAADAADCEHLPGLLRELAREPAALLRRGPSGAELRSALEKYLELPALRDDAFLEEKEHCLAVLGALEADEAEEADSFFSADSTLRTDDNLLPTHRPLTIQKCF